MRQYSAAPVPSAGSWFCYEGTDTVPSSDPGALRPLSGNASVARCAVAQCRQQGASRHFSSGSEALTERYRAPGSCRQAVRNPDHQVGIYV